MSEHETDKTRWDLIRVARGSTGEGGGSILFWCQGGDDFFEARIATQRIPKRQ